MEQRQLAYKNSSIGYTRFGRGPKTAVCFHGYGETADSYNFLDKYAGDLYSFYSIDLPFHGRTDWKEGLLFTPGDLVAIITAITGEITGKMTLMGYSLGGRVALSLYQQNPAKVERMVLLAPDGLKVNGWYWLATQSWLGNKFFALTMKKPGWFFGLLKLLNKLKLVNASIFKFVHYYIGNAQVRQLLYNRWTCLRKLKPDRGLIREQVRASATPLHLLYGKHDRIILPSVGEKFRRGIEAHCRIDILHSGHQVLHEKHVKEILPALLPQ